MFCTRNPFEVLGLNAGANVEDVRSAYRRLVKTCHPDKFQDADRQKAAQEKMIELNLAYEEALKLAASRRSAASTFTATKRFFFFLFFFFALIFYFALSYA